MAKYSVFSRAFNGVTNFKIMKGEAHQSIKKDGFTFLGVVDAFSPKKAEDIAKVRIASGLYKTTALNNSKKIAIFCDYNGVLDNFENTRKIEIEKPELERGDFYFLRATVITSHVYRIAKLALEYNAMVVATSEFRKDGVDFYRLIRSTVAQNGTDEQKQYIQDNRDKLRELCFDITGVGRSRNEEISDYVTKNDITHCVVLEDDHDIDDLYNRIWVSGYHGMSEKNFEQLEEYLRNF